MPTCSMVSGPVAAAIMVAIVLYVGCSCEASIGTGKAMYSTARQEVRDDRGWWGRRQTENPCLSKEGNNSSASTVGCCTRSQNKCGLTFPERLGILVYDFGIQFK